MSPKMIRLDYLLIILLYSAQIIEQSCANGINETTTAIPPLNVTNSLTNAHTPTVTTPIPRVTTTIDKQLTTKAAIDSKTSNLDKSTTTAGSPTISTSYGHQQNTGQHRFDTTTAAPPLVGQIPTYRQFDPLSFIGGCLLTICLVIIGTMVWKMYIAHVERRYWTL